MCLCRRMYWLKLKMTMKDVLLFKLDCSSYNVFKLRPYVTGMFALMEGCGLLADG